MQGTRTDPDSEKTLERVVLEHVPLVQTRGGLIESVHCGSLI